MFLNAKKIICSIFSSSPCDILALESTIVNILFKKTDTKMSKQNKKYEDKSS